MQTICQNLLLQDCSLAAALDATCHSLKCGSRCPAIFQEELPHYDYVNQLFAFRGLNPISLNILEKALMAGDIPPFRIKSFLLAHDTYSGNVVVGPRHKHCPGGAASTCSVIYMSTMPLDTALNSSLFVPPRLSNP